MSGGLMSCVRENSPPLEMDINVSGPLSLPEPCINNSELIGSTHSSSHHNIATSTPLAAQASLQLDSNGGGGGSGCGAASSTPIATPPNTEQTKRRRFHPLRNLRRIFRRRTITSATTATGEPPTSALTGTTASSNSEKNLRSATLSSITSVASASSPSSPVTHQQLQDAYLTQSLPKSKSAYSSLLGGSKKHHSHDYNLNTDCKGKTKHKYKNQKHQQQQQSKELDFERYQQQQQQQQQQDTDDMFGTTTQTSATYHHQNAQHYTTNSTTPGSGMTTKSSLLSQRQSMGVSVFPGAINRSFFTERQKLRSVGDSSQDLDSGSGNDSGTGGGHNSSAMERAKSGGGSASGGEMSDSQRSLSEGRLVDSDYSRDGLSQSHDSVFSESATASSLSIVLKAELADVLRKRRNRPDASDEDLGLPRSPASPQRRLANTQQNATATASCGSNKSTIAEKHSEISSLSLLSMNSMDGEDLLNNTTATTTATNSSTTSAGTATEFVQERTTATRYSRSSTTSSISISSDILRNRDSSFSDNTDEVDLFSSDWQRLSHSAAKHKMAIRPIKKKGGPSRHHRRTLETSIPEANEDLNRNTKQMQEVKELNTKAKTRSLPPGVNAAKILDETHTATKESISSISTKPENSISTQSTNTSTITSNTTTTTSTNIFGLRNLTAKASAMFESKDSLSSDEIIKKSSEGTTKKADTVEIQVQSVESTESGFLRRLMQRNSKRSIAKANAGDKEQDELDKKQNEPKKMQMSPSSTAINTNNVEKSIREFIAYETAVEEKRKDIKKEIYSDGKTTSLTSISNSFAVNLKEERNLEDKSPAKPKSGPAARQRYLPQNISNEDLVKINEEKSISKESIFSKSLLSESFQSTSLVKEITKQQTAGIKTDHHFEKKPKIVGLSAFQQKVSRSNDSFARSSSNNISTVSLDKSDEDLMSPARLHTYEQKQRKSVEKSRSFRAYGEQKENITSPTVHNNMPSLPDLSLNLRVPFYKDFVLNEKEYSSPSPPELLDGKYTSLGFEINDNKLIKTESKDTRKSLSNFDKNIILTTTTTTGSSSNSGNTPNKTTPTKLLAPAAVVTPFNSSSTNSCNKNITEIENNIDMIVKSPFVSVIRKSINLNDDQAEEVLKITAPTTILAEKVRPTVLPLKKEKSLSEENILNSPTSATVKLREKSAVRTSNLFSNNVETTKDYSDRKSAPAVKSCNGFRCNSTRRASSVVESLENKSCSTVPEFMKIQLNRVDPCRTSKSHVVLAKNIKETTTPQTRDSTPEKNFNSSSMDDLSFRRLSSESVDINERESPETEKRFSGIYHEAINKQAKLCTGLPPKSPVKKLSTTPTTPPTPTINERESIVFEIQNSCSSTTSNTNSMSLQERRRLFMSEERTKIEKKVEEMRFERKKSVCDEVNRKSLTKSESEQKEKNPKELSSPTDNSVVLRKKSFASSVHSLNGNSLNNNNNVSNKDDTTPELMKVFARRSLKIKDEDLDKILNSNGSSILSAPQTLKKFNNSAANPSLDSDKENQSASDEKLDKLPKLESSQPANVTKCHNSQLHSTQTAASNSMVGNSNNNNNNNNNYNNNTHNNNNTNGCNRNSLADFRLGTSKIQQQQQQQHHSALLTNNSNITYNNNNNNNCNNGETTGKSFLPPIKIVGGFRAISIERNNNHNNILSPTKVSCTLDRPTLKLGDLSSSSSTDGPINTSKTIERSATMGEFKGIHQRRAEWEQRAKEALK